VLKPLPEHEVALELLHERRLLFPLVIEDGLAERFALGAAALTVTRAEAESEPPGPVQVTRYVVVLLGETPSVPEVLPPVLKPEPLPEHEVALELLHESVELLPLVIEDGLAESVAFGAGVAPVTVYPIDPFTIQLDHPAEKVTLYDPFEDGARSDAEPLPDHEPELPEVETETSIGPPPCAPQHVPYAYPLAAARIVLPTV